MIVGKAENLISQGQFLNMGYFAQYSKKISYTQLVYNYFELISFELDSTITYNNSKKYSIIFPCALK